MELVVSHHFTDITRNRFQKSLVWNICWSWIMLSHIHRQHQEFVIALKQKQGDYHSIKFAFLFCSQSACWHRNQKVRITILNWSIDTFGARRTSRWVRSSSILLIFFTSFVWSKCIWVSLNVVVIRMFVRRFSLRPIPVSLSALNSDISSYITLSHPRMIEITIYV